MWVKYRKLWAYGPGDWKWLNTSIRAGEVSVEDQLKDLSHDLAGEDKYEEHYRGMDIVADTPPREVVEKRIKSLKNQIRWANKEIEELEKDLESIPDGNGVPV